MKLIIAGATGLLASEVVRQSLQHPKITSVIALSRKAVAVTEDGFDSSKLKSVVVEDYGVYPEDVKKEFEGAGGVFVGITPGKAMAQEWKEVKRVCQDCTMAGLEAMCGAGVKKRFRFVYLSGDGTERDMSKQPWVFGQYLRMRGETENMVLEFGKQHPDIEICIAKPAIITSNVTVMRAAIAGLYGVVNLFTNKLKNISREECASAILQRVVNGFEEETMFNEDLVRVGRAALTTT